jgi:hypothetical protein
MMMPMPMRGSMPPMYGPEPVYYEDPQYEYVMAPAPVVPQVQYVEMSQPVYIPPPPPPPPQPVYIPPPPPVYKQPPPPVAPRPQGNSCR